MKHLRTVLRPALLCAAAPVCLVLAACDPVDDPNARPNTWKPTPEPPRKITGMDPAHRLWLAAWRDLRTRLAPMEARLAELQKLHTESQFDNILTLDVNTLTAEQLGSLYHFLQRGYFTVERRVLIHLLERRLDRTDSALAVPASGRSRPLKDRLATAMHRDEIRMVDLETAIKFYEETAETNFQVATGLSEEETNALRDSVRDLLDKTRFEIAKLDWKIATLRAKAFPGQYPDPGPEPEEPKPLEITPVLTGPPLEITPAGALPPEDTPPPDAPEAMNADEPAPTEKFSLFPDNAGPANTEEMTELPEEESSEDAPPPDQQ